MSYSCADTIARGVTWRYCRSVAGRGRVFFLTPCISYYYLPVVSDLSLSLSINFCIFLSLSLYPNECHARFLFYYYYYYYWSLKKTFPSLKVTVVRWSRCSVTTSVFGKNNSTQLHGYKYIYYIIIRVCRRRRVLYDVIAIAYI